MATQPQTIEPLTEQEKKKVHLPDDSWNDTFALKIAKADFERAESYRKQNHDWRFRNAEEIFLAWVPQKFWEGTKQPRASLGVYLAMEQIESLLPRFLKGVFSDPLDPFDVYPRPGTRYEEARAVRDLMMWQLEEARIREVLRRTEKSAYIYGNGIVEIGWDYSKINRRRYVAEWVPVTQKIDSAIFGAIELPVDKQRRIREEVYTETTNMPYARNVDLRDFFIDPNCPSPNPQEARYVCHKVYKAVDDLEGMRGEPGFKIPDRLVLLEMARRKTRPDRDKAAVDLYRGSGWNLAEETDDPAGKKLEVIAYWTRDRLVWMLNREQAILNIANPYGFIPFFGRYYVDVPGRFYALSVCDVLEGEQRLQQSVISGRIDELSLALYPATRKRRGVNIPQAQLRRRPGSVIELSDPETDLIREEVQNVTAQAFVEVQASEQRAQKATGVTDLAVLGTPTQGGNAAARTATGAGIQAQASGNRIEYQVENAEDTVIEPLLTAWHSLNQRFLDPDQAVRVLGEEGQEIEIDPLMVKNANVKFSMRASAKMASRQGLLQAFPLIMQTFLNPDLINTLARSYNVKVNVLELGKMLEEMTGYRQKFGDLFVPLTQEERAQLEQPPSEELLRMQMQRERIEGQAEIAAEKHSADLLKTVGVKLVDELAGSPEQSSE